MTTTPDNSPNDHAEPAELLADFIDSGREEAAFVRLVEHLGGLVFSSALRRTGNRQVAEEVTQNVFAILARKADALRRHPSLTAWIFQTTRYEASKAMRSEQRRQRKHEALAREIAATGDEDPTQYDDATWREAAPMLDASLDELSDRDRELVLLRIFENKKFREIAAATGRTEAACKVQTKRALAKLSRFLSAQGATLSVAVIASGLAAELARSAPAQAAATLAPQALAASGTLGTTALIANTIQTMSTVKTVAVTGAAVLALAAVPLLWQASNTTELNQRLAELKADRESLEARIAGEKVTTALASISFNTAVFTSLSDGVVANTIETVLHTLVGSTPSAVAPSSILTRYSLRVFSMRFSPLLSRIVSIRPSLCL